MNISYIVSSYKKYEMLEPALERLGVLKSEGDEVIVFDGNSGEETINLFKKYEKLGVIDFWASEDDLGEAHGYNKAILKSSNDFIKIITDDDIFVQEIIQKQKIYMEQNVNVDIIFTSGLTYKLEDQSFKFHCYLKTFEEYKQTDKIAFCGLGMFIRRSAFAKYGLFDTRFKRVDYELSYKFGIRGAVIHFLNDLGWIRIETGKSNSLIFKDEMKLEPLIIHLIAHNKTCLIHIIQYLLSILRLNFEKTRYRLLSKIKTPNMSIVDENNINYRQIIKNANNFMKNIKSPIDGNFYGKD